MVTAILWIYSLLYKIWCVYDFFTQQSKVVVTNNNNNKKKKIPSSNMADMYPLPDGYNNGKEDYLFCYFMSLSNYFLCYHTKRECLQQQRRWRLALIAIIIRGRSKEPSFSQQQALRDKFDFAKEIPIQRWILELLRRASRAATSTSTTYPAEFAMCDDFEFRIMCFGTETKQSEQ